MTEFSTRLKSWIEEAFGSQKEFAEKNSINKVTLNGYATGKRFPDEAFLTKLSQIGCNVQWLFSGGGQMFANNEAGLNLHDKFSDEKSNRIAKKEYFTRQNQEEWVDDDGMKHVSGTMPDLKSEEVEKPIIRKSEGVPYYDIDVAASIAESFNDMPEEPEFYIDFKPFNDCEAYFPIFGDSMYPRFQNGEIIAVRKMPNRNVILWGEAYFVITNAEANNLKTIKLLLPFSEDKVILRGANPDYAYDTIIEKKDIIALYIVKGKISKYML